MSEIIHVPGQAPCHVRTVMYIGGDVLHTGYALCYNSDSGDITVEDDMRANEVEQPSDANSYWFAGVVSPRSDGVQGPAMIDIIEPGSWAQVYTDQDCTLDDVIEATRDSYVFTDTLFGWYYGATGCARCLQTVDRSNGDGPGLVFAYLLGCGTGNSYCGGEGNGG